MPQDVPAPGGDHHPQGRQVAVQGVLHPIYTGFTPDLHLIITAHQSSASSRGTSCRDFRLKQTQGNDIGDDHGSDPSLNNDCARDNGVRDDRVREILQHRIRAVDICCVEL